MTAGVAVVRQKKIIRDAGGQAKKAQQPGGHRRATAVHSEDHDALSAH